MVCPQRPGAQYIHRAGKVAAGAIRCPSAEGVQCFRNLEDYVPTRQESVQENFA